ncbi:probable RNA-binding protein CG14230 [Musca vetustissima]|uniref:probable RNA-binding protein CG14230 n=1 Tax=Musca vetustissima TaxID=27455 RepID=UPI002AB77503|nr:probable RNA-binding protein CG14230 [Musca vetustissima]
MESSRFFVANLPTNTKEKDLRNLFQDYGEIKNIELKTKENLVDPSDVKVIAFVTLNIGADDAQYCLKDLNWQKIYGQQIKVSLAKESFLERLKREREEAKAASDGNQLMTPKPVEEQSELLSAPKSNKRKIFDVDADLDDDDDIPADLLITKKRASNSLYNGKIVIQQSEDVQPIHVIEAKKSKTKVVNTQLDDKSMSADQKRKESLNKMKNQYQQQKTAIQQALQGMDASQKSKKIKFSDAESETEEVKQPVEVSKKSKTNIFGSDDDEEDETNIEFKTLPTGKKGEKLLKMQAHQSLDPRFRIDAKFVEDEDDEEEGEENLNEKQSAHKDEDNERDWQMNILELVVGTKLDSGKKSEKDHKNKKMLRYDPSKDEHQKFERSKEEQQTKKQKQTKTKESDLATPAETPAPEVSKEVFYVVKDSLQESLRTRGEGFSLLSMFGHNDHHEERDEQLKQLGSEKILVNNKLDKMFNAASNPFSYDSSSESETEELQEQENSQDKANEPVSNKDGKKSKNKTKISVESFFIPKNDNRLKEGASFFIYKKSDAEDGASTVENYMEVRERLKRIIKTKIAKTKNSLAKSGYKIKKKMH